MPSKSFPRDSAHQEVPHWLKGSSRTAVVTGASSGLGRVLAQRLAARGFALVVIARREAELEELASELHEKFGTRVEVRVADLRSSKHCQQIAEIFERDDVTLLVNNAGFGKSGSLVTMPSDDVTGQIALNVTALSILTHAAAAAFARRALGGILNVASIAGFMPIPSFAIYAATKSYVLSLSLALAEELKGSGVHVSVVCPGYIDTGFLDVSGLDSKIRASAMTPDAVADVALKRFAAGDALIVPGRSNQVLTQVATHLSHPLAAKAAGFIFRRQAIPK